MDKQRYLEELAKYLAPLSAEERQDAIDFYSKMIDDAGLVTWDAMVMKLGKPESLAHKIVGDQEGSKETSSQPTRRHLNAGTLALILLVIVITFPIWMILLGIAFGIVVAIIGAAFGVIMGIISTIMVGIILGITNIYIGILMATTNPAVSLFYIGIAIIALAIAMFLLPLIWFGFKLLIHWMVELIQWITKKLHRGGH